MHGSIFSNFPWSLVIVLVGINLIRSLLSIAGLFDGLRPIGPLVATRSLPCFGLALLSSGGSNIPF